MASVLGQPDDPVCLEHPLRFSCLPCCDFVAFSSWVPATPLSSAVGTHCTFGACLDSVFRSFDKTTSWLRTLCGSQLAMIDDRKNDEPATVLAGHELVSSIVCQCNAFPDVATLHVLCSSQHVEHDATPALDEANPPVPSTHAVTKMNRTTR